MNLSHEFSKASNLGDITKKWYAGLEKRIQEAGLETSVKAGTEAAASLLMPAALVANVIKIEGFPAESVLRVLILGDDPVPVMDRGIWLNYVAELAGIKGAVCHCICDKELESNLYVTAKGLGLAEAPRTSIEEALLQEWDLAIWIHPVIEGGGHNQFVAAVPTLNSAGVPIYACMYNELDTLIQTHGLAPTGLEFSWLHSQVANSRLTKASINKYAYATSEVGVEGGWGAVLTRVQPSSVTSTQADWDVIQTAMELFRLEGSAASSWSFGEVVAGVAFNQVRPVGLIGNLAVDPVNGLLFSECSTTKVLKVVGHLWGLALQAKPPTAFEMVPWAARIKLSFNSEITRETQKRADTIALLENALDRGLTEAGIALARGYERMNTVDSKAKAQALYSRLGDSHPMSAYAVAHDQLSSGDQVLAMRMFKSAVESGYVPAMTDLASIIRDGDLAQAHKLLTMAKGLGDAEAAFRLGEILIQGGLYEEAMASLRDAWSKGHSDALNTAHWLCTEMLKAGLGKSGKVKRELKDVQFAISKRTRLENVAQTPAG